MERFYGTDTASVELFFNVFTSGIETFVIPWDQFLYSFVVEVCRLGLKPLCDTQLHLCHSENADVHRTGISWGVRKDGSDVQVIEWMINTSQLNSSRRCVDHQDVCSQVLPWSKTPPALDILCHLFFKKIYDRVHFTVDRSWNKSLHLQPRQQCYYENSRSRPSACVMRHHYPIMYIKSLHAINGLFALGRVGNLLSGCPCTWLK